MDLDDDNFDEEEEEMDARSEINATVIAFGKLIKSIMLDKFKILLKAPGINRIYLQPFRGGPDGLCTQLGLNLEQFLAVFLIVKKIFSSKGNWSVVTSTENCTHGNDCMFARLSNPAAFIREMNVSVSPRKLGQDHYWRFTCSGGLDDAFASATPRRLREDDSRPFLGVLSDDEYAAYVKYISVSYKDSLLALLQLAPKMGVRVYTSESAQTEFTKLNPFVVYSKCPENGRKKYYAHIPRMDVTGGKKDFDNFSRNIIVPHLEEILVLMDADGALLSGDASELEEEEAIERCDARLRSISKTAPLLAKLLLGRRRKDVEEVVTKIVRTTKISVVDTIAFQTAVGLSNTRMNMVRKFCRGKDLHFAGKNQCRNYVNSQKLPELNFSEFTIFERIRYTWVNPVLALIFTIQKYLASGANMYGGGGSLSVNFQMDKGGGENKLIMNIGCPSVTGQNFPFLLGKYVGDDDYEHLKAFLEVFLEGFREISKSAIIQFSNGSSWDFIIVDAEKFPCPPQRPSGTNSAGRYPRTRTSANNPVISIDVLPAGLELRTNDNGEVIVYQNDMPIKTLNFSFDDIDDEISVLYHKLDIFFSGDCQLVCTILGMPNAETHYCFLCNASKKEMMSGVQKNILSIEDLIARVGNPIHDGSSIYRRRPLLDMIKIENFIVSLHLRLGNASNAAKKLKESANVFDVAMNPVLAEASKRVFDAEEDQNQRAKEVRIAKSVVNELSARNSGSKLCSPGAFPKLLDSVSAHTRIRDAKKKALDEVQNNMQRMPKYDINSKVVAAQKIEELSQSLAQQENHLALLSGDYELAKKMHILHHPKLVLEKSSHLSHFSEDELQACRESVSRLEMDAADLQSALQDLQRANFSFSASVDAHKRASVEYDRLVISEKKVSATVMQGMDRILRKNGIKSAHWFGGQNALQGRSTFNLFRNAQKYLPEIETMLENSKPVGATEDQNEMHKRNMEEWQTFAGHFLELMQSSAVIFAITESVSLMTVAEQCKLRENIDIFKAKWTALKWSVTPKCHMTCAHLGEHAIRTQLYGIFSESVVERMHFLCKLYRPRTHNAGDWQESERRLYRLLGILSDPAVSKGLNNIMGMDRKVKYAALDAVQKSGLALNKASNLGKRDIHTILDD